MSDHLTAESLTAIPDDEWRDGAPPYGQPGWYAADVCYGSTAQRREIIKVNDYGEAYRLDRRDIARHVSIPDPWAERRQARKTRAALARISALVPPEYTHGGVDDDVRVYVEALRAHVAKWKERHDDAQQLAERYRDALSAIGRLRCGCANHGECGPCIASAALLRER